MARRKRGTTDGVVITPDADAGIGGESDGTNAGDSIGDGNAATGDGYVEPVSVASNEGDDGNGSKPGKRGWPKGRKRGPRGGGTETRPADISGIEKLLFGIHMIGANLIAPEFAMPKEECSELAKAVQDVNRHYNIKLLDQKTADWFHLLQLTAVVYGTRFIAIRERRKRERTPPPRPMPQTGQPVPGNPAPPSPLNFESAGFRNGSDRAMRTGEVAGLGNIEFPPDHELSPRRAN